MKKFFGLFLFVLVSNFLWAAEHGQDTPVEAQDKQRDPDCAICYANDPDKETITTSCKHLFHKECITEWFKELRRNKRHRQCPLCTNKFPISKIPNGIKLIDAVLDNNIALVNQLVARRVNVNFTDKNGNTALRAYLKTLKV